MKKWLQAIIVQLTRPQLVIILLCVSFAAAGISFANAVSSSQMPNTIPSNHKVLQASDRRGSNRTSCSVKPCIALTFDDGPRTDTTPRVLDILRKHKINATFFLIGNRITGNETIIRQAHQDGNQIGNHGWSHTDFTKLTPAQIDSEIQSTQSAIASAGLPVPYLLRPPYGAVDDVVRDHGSLTIVRWNIDPDDWGTDKPDDIVKSVVSHAKPGGIILLHDTHLATVDALEPLIIQLSQQYQFVTVSQILQLGHGAQGQYFGR